MYIFVYTSGLIFVKIHNAGARKRKKAVPYSSIAARAKERAVTKSKGSNQSNSQEEDVQNRAITEETRHSDLLFLASLKEKPSPSGATVSLLLQQVTHIS